MEKFKFQLCCFVSVFTLAFCAAAAEKIVIVGDSHAYGFMGQSLETSLKTAGFEVERYAVIGTSAKSWMGILSDVPSFPQILKKQNANQFIFSLGTNDVYNQCPRKQFISDQVKKLVETIPSTAKCIWIGPPGYKLGRVIKKCGKNYDSLVDGLKAAVSERCQYIDTRMNTELLSKKENVEKDTLHVTAIGGEIWNQFILKQLGLK